MVQIHKLQIWEVFEHVVYHIFGKFVTPSKLQVFEHLRSVAHFYNALVVDVYQEV